MAAASEQDDLVKKLLTDIDESLKLQSDPRLCWIHRVPITIRRVNEKLYTPQLISIGPLHYGKPKLADMEKEKLRYVNSFFQQASKARIGHIVTFIKNKEAQIRYCYTEASPLDSYEFIRMILYDSIFIIELFIRSKLNTRDILLETMPVTYSLWTDLQLFENQLPYFILDDIYGFAWMTNKRLKAELPSSFMDLSIDFFGSFMGVKLRRTRGKVKHFTDWRRISLLEGHTSSVSPKRVIYDFPCAMKLHESGLKFKFVDIQEVRSEVDIQEVRSEVDIQEVRSVDDIQEMGSVDDIQEMQRIVDIQEVRSILDIKFNESKHPIPFFEDNELQIPKLEVRDDTEIPLINIMALEQCIYPEDTRICNYVALIDCLIDTAEDVDLLVENKIISNRMGDNASVATMFNKLNQCVGAHSSSYDNICKQLKEHCKNPSNTVEAKTKIPLKRVYFSNPLTGAATVGAILILLLTIIQTVCSILQVM